MGIGDDGCHFATGAKGRVEAPIPIVARERKLTSRKGSADGDDFAVGLDGDATQPVIAVVKVGDGFPASPKSQVKVPICRPCYAPTAEEQEQPCYEKDQPAADSTCPERLLLGKKTAALPSSIQNKHNLCPPASLMVNVNNHWFVGEGEDGSMFTLRKRNKTVTVRIVSPVDAASFRLRQAALIVVADSGLRKGETIRSCLEI